MLGNTIMVVINKNILITIHIAIITSPIHILDCSLYIAALIVLSNVGPTSLRSRESDQSICGLHFDKKHIQFVLIQAW